MELEKEEEEDGNEETNIKIKRLLNTAVSKDELAFLGSLGSALNSLVKSIMDSQNLLLQNVHSFSKNYEGRCQIYGTRIRKALPKGSKQFSYPFSARDIIKKGDLNDIYKSTQGVDGWNSLSLCPMHAAKYLYCSKNLNGFIDQIMKIDILHYNLSKKYGKNGLFSLVLRCFSMECSVY